MSRARSTKADLIPVADIMRCSERCFKVRSQSDRSTMHDVEFFADRRILHRRDGDSLGGARPGFLVPDQNFLGLAPVLGHLGGAELAAGQQVLGFGDGALFRRSVGEYGPTAVFLHMNFVANFRSVRHGLSPWRRCRNTAILLRLLSGKIISLL